MKHRRLIVLMVAALTGFLSLSQEILWMRVFSYFTGSVATIFGEVLALFLVGTALGALIVSKLIQRWRWEPLLSSGILLGVSSLVYFFTLPTVGYLCSRSLSLAYLLFYASVTLVALLNGGLFPLLCTLFAEEEDGSTTGLQLSWVYLANIIGSTLGPLATGFYLADHFGLSTLVMILSMAGLFTCLVLTLFSLLSVRAKLTLQLASLGSLALIFQIKPSLYANILEKLHKPNFEKLQFYKWIRENKSGIVALGSVAQKEGALDILFSGGAYEGIFNLSLLKDVSGVSRSYFIPALHRNPRHVFVLGLATGSWARVLATHPAVERITIVEINPAYLELIQQFPEQAKLLTDPRVKIIIDDGRRWLNRHPDARFDFVLMNTILNWRSYATNLLSQDFLKLVKSHLNPSGIVYLNSTGSYAVDATVASVFQHAGRYSTFVAGSDSPFDMSFEDRVANLMKFPPLADSQNEEQFRQALIRTAQFPFENISKKDSLIITDDNLLTEFKRELEWYNSEKSWKALLLAYLR